MTLIHTARQNRAAALSSLHKRDSNVVSDGTTVRAAIVPVTGETEKPWWRKALLG